MADPCATSTLAIPARLQYADVAAAYVAAAAGAIGFLPAQSRELAQSLLLIVQEIIARAFVPADTQDIQITCQHLPIGLKVVIAEQGLPMAAADFASLSADARICPRMPQRDTFICVRQPWDEASFENLGRAGAAIKLVKYFPGSGDQSTCPRAPLAEATGPSFGAPEFSTVRPFRAADAQEVVRLLYHTYGYSYPFEPLYYPERLIAFNAEGSLYSLVAISSQGQLVGHLAIFFDRASPDLAEFVAAAVHPGFRSRGCLLQLTEAAIDEAQQRHLQALFMRPVTNHTYSQKSAEKLGFRPCAFLVGFSPAFWSFKGIHEQLPQRESLLLVYRGLGNSEPGKIFPPSRHQEIILHLYARLQLTPEIMAAPLLGNSTPGQVDLISYPNAGIAILKVKAIGPETLKEIQRYLKQLCQSRFEVIHLHLDLTQAGTALLAPACESLGFFFAGILPGLNNTETLILQYLNNVALDYEKIQVSSPRAKELLEYVKKQDPNL